MNTARVNNRAWGHTFGLLAPFGVSGPRADIIVFGPGPSPLRLNQFSQLPDFNLYLITIFAKLPQHAEVVRQTGLDKTRPDAAWNGTGPFHEERQLPWTGTGLTGADWLHLAAAWNRKEWFEGELQVILTGRTGQ